MHIVSRIATSAALLLAVTTTSRIEPGQAAEPPSPAAHDVAGDAALVPLTADPVEQSAARTLLRLQLGPIGTLIGTPMTETISQPTYTEFRIRSTSTGYQVFLSNTDSVNGAAEHLWIDLDADLNPLRGSSYLRPMAGIQMELAERSATALTFVDRTSGRQFAMIVKVTEKDEIVLEHGYMRNGRLARLEKPWTWRSVYAVKDPQTLIARIDAYRARSEREARREAGREAFGRTLFGAMVGGWTSADKVGGMVAGAQAGAQGSDALQRQLRDHVAKAQAGAARSDTRFRDSLARLSAQTPGAAGDMTAPALRNTPEQQAKADELERFKMREQARRGEAPTTFAQDAQAKARTQPDTRPTPRPTPPTGTAASQDSASAPKSQPAAPTSAPKICYAKTGPFTQEFSQHEANVEKTRATYVSSSMCDTGLPTAHSMSCVVRPGMPKWRDCKISFHCTPRTVPCGPSQGRQE